MSNSIITDPQLSVLARVTDQERSRLLMNLNGKKCVSRTTCIHQVFERQVAQNPAAVALRFQDQVITYDQLNSRANQLAHRLRQMGVGADQLVGICVERSVEMVVGLLAILKAGGAYVAFDPQYPTERLTFMLEDTNISVLLTQEMLVDRFPAHQAQVICLDAPLSTSEQFSDQNPHGVVTGDHLAYVSYTSGSTGRPKGVCIPHRGVVRLVKNTNYMEFRESDVFLLFAPLTFDASTFELWAPLLNGGSIAICPPGQLSLSELIQVVRRHDVTTLFLTSGLFHQVVDENIDDLHGLKYLVSGGDVLSMKHVKKARGVLPLERLINAYGPTENTSFTTTYGMRSVEDVGENSVPIGRAIANTQIYVLDEELEGVEIGEPGELYTGGVGLARCYLNRPDVTAEKFIPNPFGTEPGARLYRTGDLVRYLPGGEIEFLGRIDSQVKVRGFRIELGEIEATISEHERVRDAVVVVREDVPGDKKLVAYLVTESPAPALPELRRFVKERLPEYMVPAVFMVMDELPLTANGKLDRKALPAPDQERPELSTQYVAPRDAVEEVLATIIGQVLGVRRVGIEDNFFELGGHSLLATQVISRVRIAFQVELPLRQLFEDPTVASLADSIQRATRAGKELKAPPLGKVRRDKKLPLSFAQQRLWFIDQLDPGKFHYNLTFPIQLRGELNREALADSISEILLRHESLRTVFPSVAGEPTQLILPPQRVELPILSVETGPDNTREHRTGELIERESQRPFDLAQGPLVRTLLLRRAEKEHLLILTMHHIVADGWSMRVLMDELATLYASFSQEPLRENPAPLSELPIQYADYAVWQREWLQGAALEEELAYWKEQLQGAPTLLELPTDHSRPLVQSFAGARLQQQLSERTSSALTALSQQHDVTLFMTLLSAFAVLLNRYSGQSDLVIGSPIANRTQPEIEALIGFFVNTLALRIDLSGDPTFAELLGRVRETALEAFDHQDVPFEKLVEVLHPERTLGHTPLFQVMFALQETVEPSRVNDLEIELMTGPGGVAKFDLVMEARQEGSVLGLSLEYNTQLFEAETAERLTRHFEILLESIVGNPECKLSALQMLSPAETNQLLVEWNNAQSNYRQGHTVPELFEAQVARTPDAVAVVFQDQSLTYAELDGRANQLARRLRAIGVGPDRLVGICLERSLDMVVGLLGILKAGGAYVPIDPRYPAERIAFMVEDAQAEVIVTQSPLEEVLPSHGAAIICLDRDRDLLQQESKLPTTSNVIPEHLAYVIYTSGSTGRPKGVAITHRSATVFLQWSGTQFTPRQLEGTLFSTSICFDLSVFEVFAPLSYGGTIIVAENALQLPQLRTANEVTLLNTVPSAMTELLRMKAVPPSVQVVNLAGEALPGTLVRQIYTLPEVQQVCNLYGPTEDTTYSTCEVVPREETCNPAIGRPIADTQIYLLNEGLQPVPVGVAGELYIGGEGLARGYLKRPDLTAEKFVPHPFSFTGGERLYRTGDLARYLPDGRIDYMGRIDHQVKLRGYRIELGEIEAALSSHQAIREVVVIVREDTPGDKRLVAYLVADQPGPSSAELRGHLKDKLPEYMVPGTFVLLDQLPLTPNGKLDRRALPAPQQERSELATSYVAPRNATEERVATIIEQVLGTERIGIEDNFFELGGHSLLAAQVIARVSEAFELEIPLRTLFEAPTVLGLAAAVSKYESLAAESEQAGALQNNEAAAQVSDGAGASSDSKAIASRKARQRTTPIRSRGSKDPELSYAQQRLWLLDQLQPGTSLYNVPLPIRMKGNLNQRALVSSLSEIIRRHESLRTVFPSVAGEPVQVILPPTSFIELPTIDLRPDNEPSEDVRDAFAYDVRLQQLIDEEARRPFNLAEGPLVRPWLARVADDEHLLLLTMHHIVTDGWSLKVLMSELVDLYKAFLMDGSADAETYSWRDDQASPLADLPIQYADFAIWQRQWLQAGALEEQMLYWKEQLLGAPALLELPTDHPRPAVQSFRGGLHTFTLPALLARQLRALGQQEGASLFMTLLAAFKVLLWRYSGQEQIVVGTPIANRKRVEVERLIGFFVNTLALRSELNGKIRFRELLQSVKETALGAYAHQDAPFEKLVEVLQPDRSLSYHPIFQVAFTWDSELVSTLELPDLTLQLLEIGNGASKFDLSLFLREAEGSLSGSFEFNSELFEQSTIERMTRHFEILLESIVSDPELQLSTLQMLSAGEANQLVVDWNSTDTPFDTEQTIHEMFAEHALATPEATALICEQAQLSYAELNERANQLAHLLIEQGVGQESIVAFCLERSELSIIAMLAVLKAGGAYLPLDPALPAERLNFMVADSWAEILLTTEKFADLFGALTIESICLDTQAAQIASQSKLNPNREVHPASLAYVIYTSGSTGRPKGVAIEHRQLVNYVRAIVPRLDVSGAASYASVSTLAADLGNTAIFPALSQGGCLHLIAQDCAASPAQLAAYGRQHGVDCLKLVPSHLAALLSDNEAATLLPRRRLVLGGEASSWELVNKVRQMAPECRILNHYGPTETTVGVLTCEVDGAILRGPSVPLGRPLANVRAYVLDAELAPVPIGVAGELYIGGASVGRGYVGQAAQTAERFLPEPFSGKSGQRMYRTGDLVRYNRRGEIEFLGRLDEQVKVRGYRIELGEVEAVVRGHGGVREAVVIAREVRSGEKELVAYIVGEISPHELQNYMSKHLPQYMVPARFVQLPKIPLTANGKLDRAALPAPNSAGVQADARYSSRTPVEEVVAGIWSQLLGVEQVSATDNFFELGGHSLLATQLMSRVRQSFQIDLSLRTIFECPTLRALAASIEMALRAADPSMQAPPIRNVSRDQALPLSFAQQRLWFVDQMEPNQPHFNTPLAMRLSGSLKIRALEESLAEIIRRHEVLRTTFTTRDGQSCQVIAPATAVNLPVIDLGPIAAGEREAEAQRLVNEEAQRPFDLVGGPLLRVTLLRIVEDDHILVITKHHIVTDRWSMGLFVEELATLYRAFSNGEPSPLPELPIQYADYAVWQREWLQGEALEQQLSYWRKQLAGAPAVVKLPLDRQRPAAQSLRGAIHQRTVSPELTSALRQLSQQEGCTLFMTVLAVLKSLLFYYSGAEQIVVGTDVANRNRLEIEKLCGFFINHLVLNTEMTGDPTFRELLARVREVALGAYAHQDLPFEKVVEALKPERSSSHAPLFQVLCVSQNTPGREFELPGVSVRPFDFHWATAKYDLGLFAEETPEGLVLLWNYKTDLFDPQTIERLSLAFEALLQAVATNRDQHLCGLTALVADLQEKQRTTEEQGFAAESALKFKTIKRKAVSRT